MLTSQELGDSQSGRRKATFPKQNFVSGLPGAWYDWGDLTNQKKTPASVQDPCKMAGIFTVVNSFGNIFGTADSIGEAKMPGTVLFYFVKIITMILFFFLCVSGVKITGSIIDKPFQEVILIISAK